MRRGPLRPAKPLSFAPAPSPGSLSQFHTLHWCTDTKQSAKRKRIGKRYPFELLYSRIAPPNRRTAMHLIALARWLARKAVTAEWKAQGRKVEFVGIAE